MGTLTISTLPFTFQTTSQLPPYVIQLQNNFLSYSFQLTDAQTIIPFNSGVPQVATIQPNAVVGQEIGAQLTGIQLGVGALSFVAAAGVTLLPTSTILSGGQYALMSVLQISTDVWIALGSFFPISSGVQQFATVTFAGTGNKSGS